MMHMVSLFFFLFFFLILFEIKVLHKMFYVKMRLIVVNVFTSQSHFHVQVS